MEQEKEISSSEGEEDKNYEDIPEYIPFKQRNLWKDITPIPPFKENPKIAPIQYSPKFLDISSYFRAIVEKGELSQRALALTSEVISINPGNYMAWYYRRKCLDELMPDNLDNEILLLNDFAIQMAKVYQYWHHRRLILQTIGNITVLEKEFLENIYAEDDKNYHFWTYKMWLTERFSLWEEELKWTVSELEEHPKNNSLWSYRYYIRIHTTPSPINKDFILSEIEYATTKINEDINNESAWVYLKGMFYFTPLKARSQSEDANWLRKRKMHVLEFDAVQHFCEQHIGEEGNRFSLGFMVDIYAAQDTSQSILKAKKLCEELAENVDKIRHNYWLWHAQNISINHT